MAQENGKRFVISRATMKSIKAMDREKLSEYITGIYIEGFKNGRKKSTPDDILKAFREVLISVDSIGPTRADAIMKKFSQFFGVDSVGAPQEAEQEAKESAEKTEESEADDNGTEEKPSAE